MEQEIWKDVEGFEDYYMISSLGNLFSKRSSRQVVITPNSKGYYCISTKIDRKTQFFAIHRLVANAFLEKPDKYLLDAADKTVYKKVIINHKDGNKLNNIVENLEWCTYTGNRKHAIDNNLVNIRSGLNHYSFPLTRDQVQFVQDKYVHYSKEFGCQALANLLGVHRKSIETALKIDLTK